MTAKGVAKIVGWVALGIVIAVAVAFVLGLVTQALWNWLMPVIFGLPKVTYWQALGLLVLCHLLFKSHMGHDAHRAARVGGRCGHEGPHAIKQKILDIIDGTPETTQEK